MAKVTNAQYYYGKLKRALNSKRTEVMTKKEVGATLDAYALMYEKSGKRPVLYTSRVCWICDEEFKNKAGVAIHLSKIHRYKEEK